jgi:hypothetical protein
LKVNWAEPAADIARSVQSIRAQTGTRPQVMIMSPATRFHYQLALWRTERWRRELAALRRHEVVRRYRLRRRLGEKRRRILLPKPLSVRLARAEFSLTVWRHRNDPDWA